MLGRCLFSKGDSFLKVYTWVSPSVATYVCTLPWKLTHPLLTCSQSNSASCRSSSGWGVVTSSHGVLLQDDLFFPQNTGFAFPLHWRIASSRRSVFMYSASFTFHCFCVLPTVSPSFSCPPNAWRPSGWPSVHGCPSARGFLTFSCSSS